MGCYRPTMPRETRLAPEYDALVMQVASLFMRLTMANEYVPLAQLIKQFVEDVQRIME